MRLRCHPPSWAGDSPCPPLPPHGQGKPCPYVGAIDNGDHGVDMVRHHDEGVQFDIGESVRQPVPNGLDDPARFVQQHFTVHDFSKQTFAACRANRDEVGSNLGILVFRKAERSAMASLRPPMRCQSLDL